MRIATKLTLFLLLAVAVVMAGFGYIRAQQERQRLVEELKQEVRLLANAIKLTVEHALRDRQPQDIWELLGEMVRHPNPVDRIRIFDPRLEEITSATSEVAATSEVPRAELEQVLESGETIVRYLDMAARPAVYVILPLKTRRGGTIGALEVVHVATRVQRAYRRQPQPISAHAPMTLLWLTLPPGRIGRHDPHGCDAAEGVFGTYVSHSVDSPSPRKV